MEVEYGAVFAGGDSGARYTGAAVFYRIPAPFGRPSAG